MYDPIRLEVFKHLFASMAEEMGMVLRRTGYSPNIKERRDFSCALFDADGNMIAQAAHIPVHLGAMPTSVRAAVEALPFAPGDVVILNDPFHGGTHLPDITLISPIFVGAGRSRQLMGFAANRAHHSDVGGLAPGSMPLSQELYQEGVIIPPLKLAEGGRINQGLLDLLLANVRTPDERAGDIRAQLAANRKGAERMQALVAKYGRDEIERAMGALLIYAEQMTRRLLGTLPDGTYRFCDRLDNDGVDLEPAEIVVAITIEGEQAKVDFTGTSPQRKGSVNAVYSITLSATCYVFRALIGLDIPANSGCLAPIQVIAPEGTLVNARPPAAVAGGNVETSQRITDVLLGALAKACPERVPSASQGTMNNLTIGGWDAERRRPYAYYETIGGGMGARPGKDGADAIQTHMTNTMNTPVEALEYSYPVRVQRYEIRRGAGGRGRFRGGDGIRRDIEFTQEAQVTILSERRRFPPYGLAGGGPGQTGRNVLLRDGEEHELPGKVSLRVRAGDVLSIQTPGGGGYGSEGS
ncbi:MAG: hydantoinase B/oxoprolinase family protein [Ardenticatenaceae bacterium]|nr:hydantoinase B/oxoprolinase family protein [Ardenticatenaceae bacterium]HBY93960.1 5-oxoprolinase [Chloroflexota bacterium]